MLKLDHISKTFNPGTVNEKKALEEVTLHLVPGDFVTIVGSNGAGKSTPVSYTHLGKVGRFKIVSPKAKHHNS